MKSTVIVTTAPRKECTLLKTVESLRDCGWEPTVFAEPDSTKVECKTFTNSSRKGIWHNWLSAARWSLEQGSDYIMTVQDDVNFHMDSKDFIENDISFPEDMGYISLYTPKHYQTFKNGSPKPHGFYPIKTRSMWGAMALVFKPNILQQIVDHYRAQSWLGVPPRNKSARIGWRERKISHPWTIQNSDFIIAKIIQDYLWLKLYYFNPSPCTHSSRFSAVNHGSNTGKRNAYIIANHDLPLKEQIFGN